MEEQLTIDGRAVQVRTRSGRVACAAAAHQPGRLFVPVDVMAGQQALVALEVEDSAGCRGPDVPGTPS